MRQQNSKKIESLYYSRAGVATHCA